MVFELVWGGGVITPHTPSGSIAGLDFLQIHVWLQQNDKQTIDPILIEDAEYCDQVRK